MCVCELEGGGGWAHASVCVRVYVCPEIGTLFYKPLCSAYLQPVTLKGVNVLHQLLMVRVCVCFKQTNATHASHLQLLLSWELL